MKIFVAEVIDRFDPKRNHGFFAKIRGVGDTEKWIQGTTPYLGGAQGGFVGNVPGVGVTILVVKPDNSNSWYYLGSTFEQEKNMTGGPVDKFTAEVPPAQRVVDVYGEMEAGAGPPKILAYQDDVGNGIKLVGQKRPDAMNMKAEIYSSEGKSISLNDSPGLDCIRIDAASNDEGKSVITLTDSNPQNHSMAAHMIQLESTGPQNLINMESETNIIVKDGRELQLLNNSTGSNKMPNSEDYGSVNIQSRNKDVNIFDMKEDGRIFIECLREDGFNQTIQIQTHGTQGNIIIKTNGNVGIEAGGNVDIDAGGDINMKAGGEVKINSGTQLNLQSGADIAADAGGGNNIWLNSGKSTPANPNIEEDTNTYGNQGITTY